MAPPPVLPCLSGQQVANALDRLRRLASIDQAASKLKSLILFLVRVKYSMCWFVLSMRNIYMGLLKHA